MIMSRKILYLRVQCSTFEQSIEYANDEFPIFSQFDCVVIYGNRFGFTYLISSIIANRYRSETNFMASIAREMLQTLKVKLLCIG